jgi:hypothetical protein
MFVQLAFDVSRIDMGGIFNRDEVKRKVLIPNLIVGSEIKAPPESVKVF